MDAAHLRSVQLGREHMADLLALSTEAGWNQVADDWSFMLANGVGFGFADPGGRMVASGLTVEFARYGWISMILVTPAWRRKGLATVLMRKCMDRLAEVGLVPALDASPQGREVYLKLGFRDGETSTRLVGSFSGNSAISGATISPMTPGDLREVAAFDSQSSGTDRFDLLQHLYRRLPAAAFLARRAGHLAGFAFARPGRTCAQIGPLAAYDQPLAIDLVATAAAAIGSTVCLDLLDQHADVRNFLDRVGFRPATTFVRMVHGEAEIFPTRHRTVIIGGPELS